MKIGVVGSRRRSSIKDKVLLSEKLDELWRMSKLRSSDITIVTGDCDSGGDYFARLESILRGFKLDVKRIRDPKTGEEMNFLNHRWFSYYDMVKIYYARNEEIAKENLDYLIALVASDRKGGTENTINFFKQYHKDWEKRLILL